MNKWLFPIKYKEYNSVIKSHPHRSTDVDRSHMLSYNICRSEPVLCLNGVEINSKKCTNTFIRQIFYKNRSIRLEGNFSGIFASQTLSGKKLGHFLIDSVFITNLGITLENPSEHLC